MPDGTRRRCQSREADDCSDMHERNGAEQTSMTRFQKFTPERRVVVESLHAGVKKGRNECAERLIIKKEKKCFQDAVMDKKCSDPIASALSGASNLRELVLKNKEACGLLEFYSDCIVERVVHYCGPHAKDLFSYLFDRLLKLGQCMCDEIILPADENDDRFDNLGQLDAFNFILPFFVYP
ncbi:hypothetical protein AVEN_106384-1 [Araneus ventricosus]|uniref:Uncharacterized protein n=1 Tax=Araneus ventricosus TaxID=182803 RepID=A0A4Y2ATN5_ARAVE|nr:hypothetical protein AVEN_106384-1 [Araneus ventricosus]